MLVCSSGEDVLQGHGCYRSFPSAGERSRRSVQTETTHTLATVHWSSLLRNLFNLCGKHFSFEHRLSFTCYFLLRASKTGTSFKCLQDKFWCTGCLVIFILVCTQTVQRLLEVIPTFHWHSSFLIFLSCVRFTPSSTVKRTERPIWTTSPAERSPSTSWSFSSACSRSPSSQVTTCVYPLRS